MIDNNSTIISNMTSHSKTCPRCHGKMFKELEPEGEVFKCINCGREVPCANCGKPTTRRSFEYVGGQGNQSIPDCGCKAVGR